ncbi:hypothetical protein RRG08_045391 [Elysia crispata]|uniref:Uncharacterized protein n=1 Tax=Elysia crispata TaxID=231223 RepID=A0AAE0YBC3_9GAST|nr:hypothetical protein RRG08_045391 [Elysia crispata]
MHLASGSSDGRLLQDKLEENMQLARSSGDGRLLHDKLEENWQVAGYSRENSATGSCTINYREIGKWPVIAEMALHHKLGS